MSLVSYTNSPSLSTSDMFSDISGPFLAGEEPPGWLKEEGTGKEQEPQGPPPAWKPAAGVQPPSEEEHMAGNAHLACQALPHG